MRSFPLLSIRTSGDSLVVAPNSGEGVSAETAAAVLEKLTASRKAAPEVMEASASLDLFNAFYWVRSVCNACLVSEVL